MARPFLVPHPIRSFIAKSHPDLKKKIRSALDSIRSNPEIGKALKEELVGLRSLRAGRLRVIYRMAENRIAIIAIGPRKNVYLETYRLLNDPRLKARVV